MKKAGSLFVTFTLISNHLLASPLEVAPITPAQVDAISKAVRPKLANKKIALALEQASATITEFMKIESCISGFNSTPLNQFAAPGKTFHSFNYLGVMSSMKHHAKDACLTVSKIHGFEMPAKNALTFEVVFAADDSGETSKRHYTLEQRDDAWLFK